MCLRHRRRLFACLRLGLRDRAWEGLASSPSRGAAAADSGNRRRGRAAGAVDPFVEMSGGGGEGETRGGGGQLRRDTSRESPENLPRTFRDATPMHLGVRRDVSETCPRRASRLASTRAMPPGPDARCGPDARAPSPPDCRRLASARLSSCRQRTTAAPRASRLSSTPKRQTPSRPSSSTTASPSTAARCRSASPPAPPRPAPPPSPRA
mmetsp:Transcript_28090/g.82904  ORF Transcript_28090/g.82904 Transcript_28090/m.82904 type:complete len:209 (-) Transcript_28090:531-1157(-)